MNNSACIKSNNKKNEFDGNKDTIEPIILKGLEYRASKHTAFTYTCKECGNQFSRQYETYPYQCHNCKEYDTFEMEIEEVTVIWQYCPICKDYFETSSYLNEVIEDEKVRWLANMVTHYRHSHTKSWDKMWGHNGGNYLNGWKGFKNYSLMKMEYNERAKRQILRMCKNFMLNNEFTVEHIKELDNTEDKTIELYEKILGSKAHTN